MFQTSWSIKLFNCNCRNALSYFVVMPCLYALFLCRVSMLLCYWCRVKNLYKIIDSELRGRPLVKDGHFNGSFSATSSQMRHESNVTIDKARGARQAEIVSAVRDAKPLLRGLVISCNEQNKSFKAKYVSGFLLLGISCTRKMLPEILNARPP